MSAALRRQRGAALLAMLLVLTLGGAWYLLSRLNAASANQTASVRNQNAAVLAQAKQALMGYVAYQAALIGEVNPGAFPCPEAPSGMTSLTGFDGRTQTPNCTLPAIGRFPWRTLGTDKLVDTAGEPLWYVIAPGWSKPGPAATDTTLINSNCTSDATLACNTGLLTVDGVKDTVAIIIAPGAALNAPAAAGCTAWNQIRTISATPDFRNYVECENATSPADATFVTTGPSGSFNDQVVKITAAEVLPLIEAAIAHRIEREIVPQLKQVYNTNTWGANVSVANPVYPYPAPFANPGTTASYQGNSASCTGNTCKGLLPAIFTNTPGSMTALCTPGGSSLCDPMFVRWLSGTVEVKSLTVLGIPYTPGLIPAVATWLAPQTVCTVATDAGPPQFSRLDCSAYVPGVAGLLTTAVSYEVKGTASNVGMALRQFNAAAALPGVTVSSGPTVAMNNAGAAVVTFSGTFANVTETNLVSTALCGLSSILLGTLQCRRVNIQVPLPPLFPDHALLDSTNATTGWFMRNEWYRVMHYAVAQGSTSTSVTTTPPTCATGSTCLNIANLTPAWQQRAILILTGRSINGNARPSAALADYLEFGNAMGSFERRSVTAATGAAYADSGAANAYAVAVSTLATGAALQFRAANANTGASTLTTTATGARNLVNVDGSNLASGQVQANALVEVVYDGTKFVLSKRPFNDRVIVVHSN
jgi:hypothetical protein